MANTPRSKETEIDDGAATTAESALGTAEPVSRGTVSTRSRWIISTIAGVGLLGLGLLGGMLIGEHMTPPGPHHGVGPAGVFEHDGKFGQGQLLPDEVKERMREQIKDRLQERRERQSDPSQISPSPSFTPPSDGTPNGSPPASERPPVEEPSPNNG